MTTLFKVNTEQSRLRKINRFLRQMRKIEGIQLRRYKRAVRQISHTLVILKGPSHHV